MLELERLEADPPAVRGRRARPGGRTSMPSMVAARLDSTPIPLRRCVRPTAPAAAPEVARDRVRHARRRVLRRVLRSRADRRHRRRQPRLRRPLAGRLGRRASRPPRVHRPLAATFAAFGDDVLDRDERVDRDLLLGVLDSYRFNEVELREDAWSPMAWVYLIGQGLLRAIAREFAPLADGSRPSRPGGAPAGRPRRAGRDPDRDCRPAGRSASTRRPPWSSGRA